MTRSGGTSGGCHVENKIPAALNLHVLCYRCGLQDFKEIEDNWCTNMCCCLHHAFGLKEWQNLQIGCCMCPGGIIYRQYYISPLIQFGVLIMQA